MRPKVLWEVVRAAATLPELRNSLRMIFGAVV